MAVSAALDWPPCDAVWVASSTDSRRKHLRPLSGRMHPWTELPGWRRLYHSAFILMIAALIAVSAPLAVAQDSPETEVTLPDPLTQDAIIAQVSRLSDTEVRDLLLQELGPGRWQPKRFPPAQSLRSKS